jgi:hypothetical protein
VRAPTATAGSSPLLEPARARSRAMFMSASPTQPLPG